MQSIGLDPDQGPIIGVPEGQRCTGTGLEGLQEQKSTWEASTLLQTPGVAICVFANRFVLEAGGTDVDWNDIFKTQNDI